MKKAILIASMLMAGTVAFAAEMKDGDMMMKDGKMMMMENGKAMPMTKEMTTADGTKVMADGSVMKKDGTKMKMKDGDAMGKDGMMKK